jgi:tetratricopeptide (TPR) repeat protein
MECYPSSKNTCGICCGIVPFGGAEGISFGFAQDRLLPNGEPRRSLDKELTEAFSIAEAIPDNRRALKASYEAMRAFIFLAGTTLGTWASEEGHRWVERADRYAITGTIGRVIADAGLGYMKYSAGQRKAGISLLREAFNQARNLGDNEAYAMIGMLWISCTSIPQLMSEHLQAAEELERLSRTGTTAATLGMALGWAGFTFLEYGQHQRAESCIREQRALAERIGQTNHRLRVMAADSTAAYMNGELGQALHIAGNIFTRGEELNVSQYANTAAYYCVMRPLLYRGRYDDLLKWQVGDYLTAICFAHQHQFVKVTQMLDEMINRRPQIGTPDDYTWCWVDVVWLEVAVLVKHSKACELLLHQLAGKSPKTTGFSFPTIIPCHLGAACALLGRYVEARKYYDEAIKVCTDMRFRPEMALTRLQLAELLLEHYPNEIKEAVEHLDFAIKEFREVKMQPSLSSFLRTCRKYLFSEVIDANRSRLTIASSPIFIKERPHI